MKHQLPDVRLFPEDMVGRFWLSNSDESTAVTGFLHVNESGATVHLEGTLGPEQGLQDAIVFGRLLETGQQVSLLNTFTSSMRVSKEGITASQIKSTVASFGCHEEHLQARALSFRLPYCASWFHEDAFDVSFPSDDEEAEVAIRFSAFKTFSYDLLHGYKLERSYAATMLGGGRGLEHYEVRRPMQFKLTAPSIVTFDTLWEKMRQVQRLFEFLSRNKMPPTHLALWTNPLPGAWEADVTLYLSDSKIPRRSENGDEQLIHHKDIGSRLGDMLKSWEQFYLDAPDVLARYFSAYDRDGEDAVLHFLWNAAAMEELHKVRTGNREQPAFLGRLKDRLNKLSSNRRPDV